MGLGWWGLRQDYHNRATRSHKKTIDVIIQNHKSNYFLRSLPDPKYRCYANLCKIVSVVVVVALDLLNNDNNNHIKITDGLFYELFDFRTSKWIIFSQKYVFYDHYKFILHKKVNKTNRQAYYYESYFHKIKLTQISYSRIIVYNFYFVNTLRLIQKSVLSMKSDLSLIRSLSVFQRIKVGKSCYSSKKTGDLKAIK